MTYPIGYFMWQGAKYGALLGGLLGSVSLPLFVFAIPGMITGFFSGVIIGFIVGIGIALYQFFFHVPLDAKVFRRQLVRLGAPMLFGIHSLFALLLWLHHKDWLFYQTSGGRFWWLFAFSFFTIPLLITITLAGAHVLACYADQYINNRSKHKNNAILDTLPMPFAYMGFYIRQFFRRVGRFAFWTSIGGGILFAIFYFFDRKTKTVQESIAQGVAMSIGVFVCFTLVALILALLNSWLILCLNRIYFQEYVPHLTPEQYKRRLMWCAGIATFCAAPILTFGLFLPLAVGIAVLTARTYAETYYQAGDKLKNDEKVKRAEAV
jgi:hypothetical protein